MSSNAMALALAGLALTTGALADVSTASWSEGAVHAGMHLSMAAMAPMDASSNEAFVASLKPILARELAVSEAQLVVSAVAAEPMTARRKMQATTKYTIKYQITCINSCSDEYLKVGKLNSKNATQIVAAINKQAVSSSWGALMRKATGSTPNVASNVGFSLPKVVTVSIPPPKPKPVKCSTGLGYQTETYDWVNTRITGSAYKSYTFKGDDSHVELKLPFTFTFFGEKKTTAYVSSNGYITFSGEQFAHMSNNAKIPTASAPNDLIAPYWFDLDPSGRKGKKGAPDLFVKSTSNALVVEWSEAPHILSAQKVMFQITLYSDSFTGVQNKIWFQYKTVPVRSNWVATVGIENRLGSAGVNVPKTDTNVLFAKSALSFCKAAHSHTVPMQNAVVQLSTFPSSPPFGATKAWPLSLDPKGACCPQGNSGLSTKKSPCEYTSSGSAAQVSWCMGNGQSFINTKLRFTEAGYIKRWVLRTSRSIFQSLKASSSMSSNDYELNSWRKGQSDAKVKGKEGTGRIEMRVMRPNGGNKYDVVYREQIGVYHDNFNNVTSGGKFVAQMGDVVGWYVGGDPNPASVRYKDYLNGDDVMVVTDGQKSSQVTFATAVKNRMYSLAVEYDSTGGAREFKTNWNCVSSTSTAAKMASQASNAANCRSLCEATVGIKFCAYQAADKKCFGFGSCAKGSSFTNGVKNVVWQIVHPMESRNSAGRRRLTLGSL